MAWDPNGSIWVAGGNGTLLVSNDEGNPFPGFPKDCLPDPRGVIGTPDRIPELLLQLVIRLFPDFHLLVLF